MLSRRVLALLLVHGTCILLLHVGTSLAERSLKKTIASQELELGKRAKNRVIVDFNEGIWKSDRWKGYFQDDDYFYRWRLKDSLLEIQCVETGETLDSLVSLVQRTSADESMMVIGQAVAYLKEVSPSEFRVELRKNPNDTEVIQSDVFKNREKNDPVTLLYLEPNCIVVHGYLPFGHFIVLAIEKSELRTVARWYETDAQAKGKKLYRLAKTDSSAYNFEIEVSSLVSGDVVERISFLSSRLNESDERRRAFAKVKSADLGAWTRGRVVEFWSSTNPQFRPTDSLYFDLLDGEEIELPRSNMCFWYGSPDMRTAIFGDYQDDSRRPISSHCRQFSVYDFELRKFFDYELPFEPTVIGYVGPNIILATGTEFGGCFGVVDLANSSALHVAYPNWLVFCLLKLCRGIEYFWVLVFVLYAAFSLLLGRRYRASTVLIH